MGRTDTRMTAMVNSTLAKTNLTKTNNKKKVKSKWKNKCQ